MSSCTISKCVSCQYLFGGHSHARMIFLIASILLAWVFGLIDSPAAAYTLRSLSMPILCISWRTHRAKHAPQIKTSIARPNSRSIKATVPEVIAEFLELKPGNTLEWQMEINGEKRTAPVKKA